MRKLRETNVEKQEDECFQPEFVLIPLILFFNSWFIFIVFHVINVDSCGGAAVGAESSERGMSPGGNKSRSNSGPVTPDTLWFTSPPTAAETSAATFCFGSGVSPSSRLLLVQLSQHGAR